MNSGIRKIERNGNFAFFGLANYSLFSKHFDLAISHKILAFRISRNSKRYKISSTVINTMRKICWEVY